MSDEIKQRIMDLYVKHCEQSYRKGFPTMAESLADALFSCAAELICFSPPQFDAEIYRRIDEQYQELPR